MAHATTDLIESWLIPMKMKRLLLFVTVVALSLVTSGVLLAQANPFVGTWKLNPAKSKFGAGAPPKEETITIQTVGDQDQVMVNSTAADGSASWGYEVPVKGGTGKILAGPWDAVSSKWIDDHTRETIYMKGGKEIRTNYLVVSKNGKTLTITFKGTSPQIWPLSLELI